MNKEKFYWVSCVLFIAIPIHIFNYNLYVSLNITSFILFLVFFILGNITHNRNYLIKEYGLDVNNYLKVVKSHKFVSFGSGMYRSDYCKNCNIYALYDKGIYWKDPLIRGNNWGPITTTCEEQQCKDILL